VEIEMSYSLRIRVRSGNLAFLSSLTPLSDQPGYSWTQTLQSVLVKIPTVVPNPRLRSSRKKLLVSGDPTNVIQPPNPFFG
jgi:hypothetical protein